MQTDKFALFLILFFGLISTIRADWSLTKLITIHHLGSPSENDGLHPEAFLFEKKLAHNRYYSLGIVENSEERIGPIVGYTKVLGRRDRLAFTGNIYLSSNYNRLPFIMPIPTAGIRYQLTKDTQFLAEAVPVPDEDESYVIFMTGINVDF